MNPVTALSLLLAGLSLWLQRTPGSKRRSVGIAEVCAGLVAAIGLSMFFSYAVATRYWLNWMGPNTALVCICIGLSLGLLDYKPRRKLWPAAILANAAILIALMAAIGYAYDAKPMYELSGFLPMPPHAAGSFLGLGLGILCARPDAGLVRILKSDSPGGVIARWMLPAVFVIPIAVGWIRIAGQRAGLFESTTGTELHVIATILMLSVLVWGAANVIDRASEERQHAEGSAQEANRRLELANKELESFSYSVSHDLRAPLRHINGFADLLSQHSGARLDESGSRYLEKIRDGARRMGMLIDQLLEFSKMGRKEIRKIPISLRASAEDVVAELKESVSGRTIEWRVGALPEVEADGPLLRQVFANLIGNAVKYTAKRAEALIEIGSIEGERQEAVVFVRDNGAGFDMRYADKLFGVFQRLHSTEEFEGAGIGLANVRRIVDRHGGRTWAEGRVDHGATFYFSLPVRAGVCP